MRVFLNYAKNYASAIYMGLHTTSLSVAVPFPRKVKQRQGNVDVHSLPFHLDGGGYGHRFSDMQRSLARETPVQRPTFSKKS